MKSLQYPPALIACLAFFICLPSTGTAGDDPDATYTSPSGAWRVQIDGEEGFVVSTKDPKQHAKLPPLESAGSSFDDEFHFSPDDKWIFGLRHIGSGLRNGNLCRFSGPLKIEVLDRRESFNELAWKNCRKLGVLKQNYSEAGVYAMTFFGGWSLDSGRLLFRLSGGGEKRSMEGGYLYFNTRTKSFELTDYLRKLNRSKSLPAVCAEPTGPLPPEPELKARFDRLDRELNQVYGGRISKLDADRVSRLREDQRTWIKDRDEGLKLYLASMPTSEAGARRLQFLGDVTATRIEQLKSVDQDS